MNQDSGSLSRISFRLRYIQLSFSSKGHNFLLTHLTLKDVVTRAGRTLSLIVPKPHSVLCVLYSPCFEFMTDGRLFGLLSHDVISSSMMQYSVGPAHLHESKGLSVREMCRFVGAKSA